MLIVMKLKTGFKSLMLFMSIALFFVLSAKTVQADPAPLGLEVGKATLKDAKKAYRTEYSGMNQYSLGTMLKVSGDQTGISGVTEATLIFNLQERLVAVLLELPKSRFDALYEALSNKYRVTSREIPFVGNKKVVMRDGHTEITLNAPHMSFEMSLNYIEDGLNQSYKDQKNKEERAKKQQEASNL